MSFSPDPRSTPGYAGDYVPDRAPSKVAGGLRLLCGVLMLTTGLFQVLQGIVAVNDKSFFAIDPDYTFDTDVTGVTQWGWLHILFGAGVAIVGLLIVFNTALGRALGIPVLIVSMMSNFLFIPYYPFWTISIIVFDVFALWALVTAPTN